MGNRKKCQALGGDEIAYLGQIADEAGAPGMTFHAGANAAGQEYGPKAIDQPSTDPQGHRCSQPVDHGHDQKGAADNDGQREQRVGARGCQHAIVNLQHVNWERQHQQVGDGAERKNKPKIGAAVPNGLIEFGAFSRGLDEPAHGISDELRLRALEQTNRTTIQLRRRHTLQFTRRCTPVGVFLSPYAQSKTLKKRANAEHIQRPNKTWRQPVAAATFSG
jgi:hypothetical protein